MTSETRRSVTGAGPAGPTICRAAGWVDRAEVERAATG